MHEFKHLCLAEKFINGSIFSMLIYLHDLLNNKMVQEGTSNFLDLQTFGQIILNPHGFLKLSAKSWDKFSRKLAFHLHYHTTSVNIARKVNNLLGDHAITSNAIVGAWHLTLEAVNRKYELLKNSIENMKCK